MRDKDWQRFIKNSSSDLGGKEGTSKDGWIQRNHVDGTLPRNSVPNIDGVGDKHAILMYCEEF